MRIVVVGGGTGGHVTPLKPVIKQLKKLGNAQDGAEITYVGQKGDQFSKLIEKDEVYQIKLIRAGKYRRYPNETFLQRLTDVKTNLLNVRDLFYIIFSTVQMYFFLRKLEPEVVFGNGGYVSVPVGWAARLGGWKLVVHESDAKIGIATKLLASGSEVVLTGVPIGSDTIYDKPVHHVGIPLRDEFSQKGRAPTQAQLKEKLGFATDKPLVTVSGGSLGASAINNAVLSSLDTLLQTTQIAHITGENNLESVRRQANHGEVDGYQTIGFTDQLDAFFRASDLVITRASATTFSELAVLGKPAILIPGMQLSDQIENAKVLSEVGAVKTLDERTLARDPKLLQKAVSELLSKPDVLTQLSEHISKLAKRDAANSVAQAIYKVGLEEQKDRLKSN